MLIIIDIFTWISSVQVIPWVFGWREKLPMPGQTNLPLGLTLPRSAQIVNYQNKSIFRAKKMSRVQINVKGTSELDEHAGYIVRTWDILFLTKSILILLAFFLRTHHSSACWWALGTQHRNRCLLSYHCVFNFNANNLAFQLLQKEHKNRIKHQRFFEC